MVNRECISKLICLVKLTLRSTIADPDGVWQESYALKLNEYYSYRCVLQIPLNEAVSQSTVRDKHPQALPKLNPSKTQEVAKIPSHTWPYVNIPNVSLDFGTFLIL